MHLSRLEAFLHDAKYGVRTFRRDLVLTAAVILTLALGIGANTAIFSVTYGVLLKPLPYPNSARLLRLSSSRSAPKPAREFGISGPELQEIQTQSQAFEQLAEDTPPLPYLLSTERGGEQLGAVQVSGNYFTLLGIGPILGRPILPADVEPDHNVAVLSFELWQERFGADPAVVGKKLTLSDRSYEIIGVMPPRSRFPNPGDLWIPFVVSQDQKTQRRWRPFSVVARLRDGASLSQANSELHTIAARLADEYPATDKGWDLSARSILDEITTDYSSQLLILLGAASLVLLLACVNVGSLLIAKNSARQRELAIRTTLGATRGRLVAQLLIESIILALLGGGCGLVLARWGVSVLRAIAPPNTPRINEVAVNMPVLWYGLAISLMAALVFGLAPALGITRASNGGITQTRSRSLAHFLSRRSSHTLDILVVAEVALAFLLVTSSTLAIRSFWKLMHVELGYRVEHVLTMRVTLSFPYHPSQDYVDRCNVALRQILDRVRALPGVQSAAFSAARPFSNTTVMDVIQIGGQPEGYDQPMPESVLVAPGYFRTMSIPLLMGRDFTDQDTKDSPPVAVVNHSMAARYFDGKPLGRRFNSRHRTMKGETTWLEVVGEVGDTRDVTPSQQPLPAFYTPYAQDPTGDFTYLMVRTSAAPLTVSSQVRQQVLSIDPGAAIASIRTMDQVLYESVAEPRFRAMLLGTFGSFSLLLALLGVYGLTSFAVSRRTHEMGVRVALGAQPRRVFSLILRRTAWLCTLGLTLGIGASLGLTHLARNLLFEIAPTDPVTFSCVATLMVAVMLGAAYGPAERASRVDPMTILRHE